MDREVMREEDREVRREGVTLGEGCLWIVMRLSEYV
jgi:hypothetical protein